MFCLFYFKRILLDRKDNEIIIFSHLLTIHHLSQCLSLLLLTLWMLQKGPPYGAFCIVCRLLLVVGFDLPFLRFCYYPWLKSLSPNFRTLRILANQKAFCIFHWHVSHLYTQNFNVTHRSSAAFPLKSSSYLSCQSSFRGLFS